MKYRVTCLTPSLVGDGQRLSPIDYMVWKDHVNILDQHRIFRLLAKGPRLDSYLTQLKRAEKLDFASWGGFAQNYAGRRIPFEHPSSTQFYERARAENLFVPTFASGPRGPYLPGSALKGALRTGYLQQQVTEGMWKDLAARLKGEGRLPRRPAEAVEQAALGNGSNDAMKPLMASDSDPVATDVFKIYLLRVSTLEQRSGRLELAWKTSPRGTVKRAEDSTPIFAEMAAPGTTFTGDWQEKAFYKRPEVARVLRRRAILDAPTLFTAINGYIEQMLSVQARYAEWAGLQVLGSTIAQLQERLGQIREASRGCILPLGWGAGFFSKTVFPDTREDVYRDVLTQVSFFSQALRSGLPFPKTRKVVFLGNQPAALPGFVHLELLD
ncbi:MAG TPA: type III-A CRISPR-associated RAMP protein Csm5 [Bryobacteraceae bacterium]|nr:type III-A CRISPR-associated RAMP protein Csm5 [Bryobacteraceae bacterium]